VKLSKKIWLFLAIAIFAIVVTSLGMVQSQQAKEQSQLKQELSLAQLQLGKSKDLSQQLSSQREDLENRLTQAESQLTTAKAGLFQLIETIEVSDTLFDIAEASGVEIIQITSSAPTDMELEGIACSALKSSVQIEGDVTSLIDFVLKWTETFRTGVVVSVRISPPGVKGVEEEQTEGEEPAEEEEQAEEEGENEGEETEEEETVEAAQAQEEGQGSASIELLIYTYRGD